MAKSPQNAKDFAILPVVIPPVSTYVPGGTAQHFFYIQTHAPKVPTPQTPRSLFVANIPVDATLTHFRTLFAEQLGGTRVERVEIDSINASSKSNLGTEQTNGDSAGSKHDRKRKRGKGDGDLRLKLPETWDGKLNISGSTGVIVFVDRASMQQALGAVKKVVKSGSAVYWGGESLHGKLPALGSKRYASHHALRYPPTSQLQSLVDSFMTEYSSRETALQRTRTRQRSVPDADGFIIVTRGGRTAPARTEEAKEKLEMMREKEEKKRKDMEMSGFYRFQVREAKKREAQALIGKFEVGRRRMEELSKRRKRARPE